MISKNQINNASILLSINTHNKFLHKESAFKVNNNKEYDSPIKERLLTLTNQNHNYGIVNTQNSINNNYNNNNRNNRNYLKTNENTILNTGLNLVSPKMNYKNYKSFNDSSSPSEKYKENYNSTVIDLKDKLENSINFHLRVKNNKTRNLPLGMKFNEIPHIQTKKPSDNYRINLLLESLERSINYQKPTVNTGNLNEIIQEENNRLKLFKKNLDAFTGTNSPKHPNLNQITKMTKLKESSVKISNSRFMGSKYDPYNYPQ